MRSRLYRSVACLLPLALVTGLACVEPRSSGSGRKQRHARERPGRPNILIVVTDDQRTATMAVMRRTRAWLDDGGIQFTRAHVTTPRCCPSRASIFSGKYAHNTGVKTNEGAILDTDKTMQAYLNRAGYRTGFIGKYLNDVSFMERPPHFDKYSVRHGLTFYDSDWNVQGRVVRESAYETNVIRRRATRYLRVFDRNDDDPWFLYLAPIAPHLPATPQKKYASARVRRPPSTPAMREDDRSDKPSFVRDDPLVSRRRLRRLIALQQRSLLSVDDMMHALKAQLRELGELRRTLIIFTSDNGFLWRDHGVTGKNLPYIPSVRVPFYLRWGRRLPAGTNDKRLIGNIDIAPTVLDAAGVEPDVPMDGRSLLDTTWVRDRILLENWHPAYPPWSALLTRSYQYIEYRQGDGSGVVREYYDLVADPWQLSNLFGDRNRSNDPNTTAAAARLKLDRSCAGTATGDPQACP